MDAFCTLLPPLMTIFPSSERRLKRPTDEDVESSCRRRLAVICSAFLVEEQDALGGTPGRLAPRPFEPTGPRNAESAGHKNLFYSALWEERVFLSLSPAVWTEGLIRDGSFHS